MGKNEMIYPILWFYRERLSDTVDLMMKEKGFSIEEFKIESEALLHNLLAYRKKVYSETEKTVDQITCFKKPTKAKWAGLKLHIPMTELPLFESSIKDDYLSHYAMRLIGASNQKLIQWIVQQETLLFVVRFEKENGLHPLAQTKKDALELLFGNENIKFEYENGSIKKVSVRWELVAPIVFQWDSYIINGGWVDIQDGDIYIVVKSVIRHIFNQAFKEAVESIPKDTLDTYRTLADSEFTEVADTADLSKDFTEIDQIVDNSPMCIVDLDRKIRIGENIGHMRSLQLSFYMKTFLDRLDLMSYWWKRNINNKDYASLDDFLRSRRELEYQFKHQFGEAGAGGKSYKAYKCETCQTGELYCFFQNDESTVKNLLVSKYHDEIARGDEEVKKIIGFICKNVRESKPNMACAWELALRTHTNHDALKKIDGYFSVSHPVFGYYRRALKLRTHTEESEKTDTTEVEHEPESLSDIK